MHVQQAPEGITQDTEGSHAGGSGTLITLTRAIYRVPPRLLGPLHEFFSSALLLQPGEVELSEEAVEHGGGASYGSCVVRFNSGQQLVFAEADPNSVEPPPEADDRSADGGRLSVAVFVDSVRGFRDTWEAAMRHRSSSGGGTDGADDGGSTWEAASTSGAFRVRTPLAALDVEVRSLAHAECPLPRRDLAAAGVMHFEAPPSMRL